MAERTNQSLPIENYKSSQPRIRQGNTHPSFSSSASDERLSSSSSAARRYKQSSRSPNSDTHSAKTRDSSRQKQKASTMPHRGRESAGRGSTLQTAGLLEANSEITYTPTTHRISKAKKGKKVHACEYPGCSKIFTRAEHRKRHEANHNTSPAFKCERTGCGKPFHRADLLARHMERQHNMPPAEASAFKNQYRQSSISEASSPSGVGMSIPHMGQPTTATAPSLPQPSGTMSIGSIIEPNMHGAEFKSEFASQLEPSLHELPRAPIGTTPNSLPPELLYGLAPAGDSPLYSSSDSCYSPVSGMSDYLQPAVPQPYYPQEIVRRSQSTSVDSCFQPMLPSPMSSVGSGTPGWSQYDPSILGFAPEPAYHTPSRHYHFHSPSWPETSSVPSYEMGMPAQQQPWPWTKVNF